MSERTKRIQELSNGKWLDDEKHGPVFFGEKGLKILQECLADKRRLEKGRWVWAEVYVTSDPYPKENPNPLCFSQVFQPDE